MGVNAMVSSIGDLQPIRIILEGADLAGWVQPGGQRMTDILQAGEPFAFLPADANPVEWTEIYPDEIVLIVPPPHVSAPELRQPRNLHEVLIRAGEYRVTGIAYLRPGEQDDPVLRASRRFLPLTQASFGRSDAAEQTAEVVIVNLRRVNDIHTV
jgi:hypothetical protein